MELASFGGPQVARAEKQQYSCGMHVDAGQVSEPVMLREMNMGMGMGFSSDMTLPKKGTFEFTVGSRLAGGKTRQSILNTPGSKVS